MVKLYIAGLGIFAAIVVGAFSAIMAPLMAGVDSNLGGSPTLPFHAPIPAPVVAALHSATGHATPSVLLTGALGAAALLFVYSVGTLFAFYHRRWREGREHWARLRWQARMADARQASEQPVQPSSGAASPQAEMDALWE